MNLITLKSLLVLCLQSHFFCPFRGQVPPQITEPRHQSFALLICQRREDLLFNDEFLPFTAFFLQLAKQCSLLNPPALLIRLFGLFKLGDLSQLFSTTYLCDRMLLECRFCLSLTHMLCNQLSCNFQLFRRNFGLLTVWSLACLLLLGIDVVVPLNHPVHLFTNQLFFMSFIVPCANRSSWPGQASFKH